MKDCIGCGERLPIDMFFKNNSAKDGRKSMCKPCCLKYSRELRAKNAERIRAKKKKWMENNRARVKLSRDKYWTNHPERRSAYNKLENAVKCGAIAKPRSCDRCGCSGRIEAHHEDYSKPLIVEWLCRKCHDKKHRRLTEAMIVLDRQEQS